MHQLNVIFRNKFKTPFWGFPGGSVVKGPPANAADTASAPGPGGFYMLWDKRVRVPQILRLCSGAQELQPLKPTSPRALALQWEA